MLVFLFVFSLLFLLGSVIMRLGLSHRRMLFCRFRPGLVPLGLGLRAMRHLLLAWRHLWRRALGWHRRIPWFGCPMFLRHAL